MKKVCKNEGIKLPKKGDYGVGMLFLSPDKDTREESLERLTKIIDGEKQKLLGIREVPVYDVCIGNSAREAMPHIVQVFIGKGDESLDADSFERKLYIIGKLAEKEIRKSGLDNYFYFASLSARTVVYKGMLTPDQVNEFYLDLKRCGYGNGNRTCALTFLNKHIPVMGKSASGTDTLSITAKLTLSAVM